MYDSDRGIEELLQRRGDDEVSMEWLAAQMRLFVDPPHLGGRRRPLRRLSGPRHRRRLTPWRGRFWSLATETAKCDRTFRSHSAVPVAMIGRPAEMAGR